MTSKILVVEDDEMLRVNIVDILEAAEYEVFQVDSADQAINLCQTHIFEVAILDYLLPGMTGTEAISNLRQYNPNLSVILVTAFATVDIAVDAMQKGANDFIPKPFSSQKLLMTVKRCIAEKALLPDTAGLNMDKVYSTLSNPIRRDIIKHLAEHPSLKFMEICRLVEVEDHTKLNFHIQQLKKSELIVQGDNREYRLSKAGEHIFRHQIIR
ncbi:ArsR family transcriptional regulator [Photobacterium sanctipauli]|uniref:ArsR family transcriptional regulator n=1 Tax=Photobacterium sanctipauli TaxID=1342794 RepID=A0A2T3NYY0_9GAMM|nr:response regulator [Photobacterium sanctipauli]PSW21419.1 ArsR family transcriptional regulator [Photobacterium sanctipauli]